MRRANQELRRFRPGVGRLEDRALLSTFTVTNLNNAGAGSLRRAVDLSNLTPGADTIAFKPGLTGTITLTSGQLALNDSVTITGPGASKLAVTSKNSRIFEVDNTTATISGLTLLKGKATTGGAILENGGSLTVKDDFFVRNSASQDGGAIENFFGTLDVKNDTFFDNKAKDDGGAILNSGTMTVEGSNFVGNTAGGRGGAVQNATQIPVLATTATITNTSFTGNHAEDGGAVSNQNGSSLTLSEDRFIANDAKDDGGALFNGADADTTDNVDVSDSTFQANTAGDRGGAIFSNDNLNSTNNTIQFNDATNGGAVWALAGTFTSIGDTIDFNSTPEITLV